jgi:hypothetical protein
MAQASTMARNGVAGMDGEAYEWRGCKAVSFKLSHLETVE